MSRVILFAVAVASFCVLTATQPSSAQPDCPDVWANVVFGFELHYRSTYNWLLEYHGMDALRRHRFYIGLTTRRGN